MAHNRLTNYFVESYHELAKVSWPTKSKAINICVLVLIFLLVSAAFIAGVDFIFNKGYGLLLNLAGQQGGSLQ